MWSFDRFSVRYVNVKEGIVTKRPDVQQTVRKDMQEQHLLKPKKKRLNPAETLQNSLKHAF